MQEINRCNPLNNVIVGFICFERNVRMNRGCAVFSLILLLSFSSMVNAQVINIPTWSPNGYDHEQWVNCKIKDNAVIKAGSYIIPVPIRLPHNMMPVGNKVILRSEYYPFFHHNKHFLEVRILFPAKDEKILRQWVTGLPAHMPLANTAGTYQIAFPHPFKVDIKSVFNVSLWHFEMMVKTKKFTISYSWLVQPNFPMVNQEPLDDPQDRKEMSAYIKLFRGKESPVRYQKRLLEFTVSESVTIPRGKS